MPFWEKGGASQEKKAEYVSNSPDAHDIVTYEDGEISENADNLQRRLNNRQIQLIAIGGSIGTALFVSIGGGLHSGGPGSLFIAYFIYACMLALVNNSIAEMTVLYPVSGGFVRLAGHFVDDAFGFMAGWNFFIYEALLIPFEITALTLVLGFWSDNIPAWAIPIACIVSARPSNLSMRPATNWGSTDPLRVRFPVRQIPLRLHNPQCASRSPSIAPFSLPTAPVTLPFAASPSPYIQLFQMRQRPLEPIHLRLCPTHPVPRAHFLKCPNLYTFPASCKYH